VRNPPDIDHWVLLLMEADRARRVQSTRCSGACDDIGRRS
jgi:hypothetical protein